MIFPLPKGDGRRRRQGSQVLSLPLSGSFEIVFEHEVTVAPRQFADRDGIPPLWWLVLLRKADTPATWLLHVISCESLTERCPASRLWSFSCRRAVLQGG